MESKVDLDDVRPMRIEGRIKIPYRWPAGRVAGRFLETWRNEGRILGLRCAGCGRVVVPPRPRCLCSSGAEVEWTEVGPEGTVVTWTRTEGGTFALVRPDGADTAILQKLPGDADVGTGMRVTLRAPGQV